MPCPLEAQIQSDLVAALKNQDSATLSVLRMLKASIQLALTEKSRKGDLTDEEVHTIIRRAIKQREEAADRYREGNAHERAAEELEEAKILKGYLPAELEDSALDDIVSAVIGELGANGQKDFGRVMGKAMNDVKGRADGNRVKAAVTRLLKS